MPKGPLLAIAVAGLLAAALPAEAAVTVYAPAADVVINELACDSSSGEYIELANRNGKLPVLVGGWQLSDEPPATAVAAHRYRIPAGAKLAPGARLLVRAGAKGLPFGLSCGTDEVYLAQGLGASFSLVDQVSVPNLTAAAAWGRDAAGAWQPQQPTPGAANTAITSGVAFDRAAWLFDAAREVRIDLTVGAAAEQSLVDHRYQYVSAQFRLTAEEGALPSEGPIEVGLRLKGGVGSFLPYGPNSKSGFKLKFGEFVAGQRFEGLKKLTLNNMRQDPTLLREALTYELFRYFGIPAPRTGFANVYVNGQLRGLYLLLEPYDDVSLDWWTASLQHLYDAHWSEEPPFTKPELDSWDLARHFEVDEGDANDYTDLEELADAIAVDGPMDAEAAKRIDFRQLGVFLAVEKYTSHWDGYSGSLFWTPNNYNLMSDRFGRFTLLPWGADQTWGYVQPKESFGSAQGLLFSRCLQTAGCRAAYYATLEGLPALVSDLGLAQAADSWFEIHGTARRADTVRQSSEAESVAELALVHQFIGERPNDVATFLTGRQTQGLTWQPRSKQLAFGARLTPDLLNASVDAAGTLTYSRSVGAVLPLGNTTVRVTFQPAAGGSPTSLERTFTVKRAQSIALANPGARKLSAKSVAVAPKATSGLAAKLTSSTPGVCTASGTKVTLKKRGLCVLRASQPGNATFAPAPVAMVSFRVG